MSSSERAAAARTGSGRIGAVGPVLAVLLLALAVGPELLVVGALSFAAGWLYTGGPKPYGYLGLGEVFVFVFFGLFLVVSRHLGALERWVSMGMQLS